MLKHILTFSFFTFISRILGLVRDTLVAIFLGAESMADVFFVAFRLPNLFRALFAEGAFNIAFVPLYAAKIHDEKEAQSFATNVFSILFLIVLGFCSILYIFLPYVMKVFTPGFYANPEKFNLAINLSRIMLPYLLFISLASLIGGMLQVKQHFASTAGSPIILNLCLISSVFIPYMYTLAHNLASAVFIAGVLQFLLMAYAAFKLKIHFEFTLRIKIDDSVKLFLKRVIPAIVINCLTQLSIWIDTIFASLIPGAVSYIYYADRINQLPQAMIGIAIGTVLLPLISKHVNSHDIDKAIEVQNKSLELGLMIAIPAAGALAIIADSVLLALFGYGKFDYNAIKNTAPVLTAFAPILPAFVMSKILLPTFYAYGKIKIPMTFSIIALTINVIMNFMLMNSYKHIGIAVASSVASWINVILLIIYLRKHNLYRISKGLSSKLTYIGLATIIMMMVLFIANSFLMQFFFAEVFIKVISLVTLIAIGIFVYFCVLFFIFRIKIPYFSVKDLLNF